MLSNKMNVLQLAVLMRAHGVRDVVLCPGSRDIPLTQTFSHIPDFRCYSLTDERSAGFFALGLAVQQGAKVAVVVTSGSAVANLYPAVCEAFYQQVPLLVISADRPEAWIGQMDGQTMPQPHLFQSLVRKAVSLPEVHDDESLWYCNRLINEALLELDHGVMGPVQINVPISDPFFDFSTEQLPPARVIRRWDLVEFGAWLRQHEPELKRILLVVGQNNAMALPQLSSDQSGALHRCLQVFSELPSNWAHYDPAAGSAIGPDVAVACGKQLDWMFTTLEQCCLPEELAAWTPQLVITVGGHIVSKKLKQFLRKHPPKYQVLVNPRGEVSDLFMHLTHVVEAAWPSALATVIEALTAPTAVQAAARSHYGVQFKALYQQVFAQPLLGAQGRLAPVNDAEGDDVVNFIARVLERIPAGSTLHLGNSSALRFAEFAALAHPAEITVHCNRGINGIEGSVSEAVGAAYLNYVQAAAAQGTAQPETCPLHFLVVGDLSFYYDFNGLWHRQVPPNLRLVLINNSGGEIFRLLPGLKLDECADALVRGVHHSPSLGQMQARLAAMGIDYREVGAVEEAWGQAAQSGHKAEESSAALAALSAPFTAQSRMLIVEYHSAPADSKVFTQAIELVRSGVCEYLRASQPQVDVGS